MPNGSEVSLASVTLWTELSMGDNGCRWENLAQQRIGETGIASGLGGNARKILLNKMML